MSRAWELLEQIRSEVECGTEYGLSRTGVIQLEVSSGVDSVVRLLEVGESSVRWVEGVETEPSAALRLSASDATAFSQGLLELRDPPVLTRVDARGDVAQIMELIAACQRPTALTKRVFQRAVDRARTQPGLEAKHYDHAPTESSVHRHIEAGRPAVFQRCSPASGLTLEQLAERHGDTPLLPGVGRAETVGSVVDRIRAGERAYSHGCKVPQDLLAQFDVCVFQRGGSGPLQMWLGSRSDRLVTRLHREVASALLFQVIGRKRLLLYSPDQEGVVYGRRAYRSYQACWADPDRPDPSRFAAFSNARALVVDLAPGQALLIPAGWYHCAYAIDDVLSVSTAIPPSSRTRSRL
jgi:hypothetical protein